MTPDERIERVRALRKRLRAINGIVAVIDHRDFVCAYTLPSELARIEKTLGERADLLDGFEVRVAPAPPPQV